MSTYKTKRVNDMRQPSPAFRSCLTYTLCQAPSDRGFSILSRNGLSGSVNTGFAIHHIRNEALATNPLFIMI